MADFGFYWQIWYSSPVVAAAVGVALLILLITITFLLMYSIRIFYCHTCCTIKKIDTDMQRDSIDALYWLHKVLFTASAFFGTIAVLIYFLMYAGITFFNMKNILTCDIRSLASAPYGLQRSCMSVLLVHRVFKSFENTFFAFNKRFLILFIILLIAVSLGIAVFFLYMSFSHTTNKINNGGDGFDCRLSDILFWSMISLFVDGMIQLTIGLVFYSKLRKVIDQTLMPVMNMSVMGVSRDASTSTPAVTSPGRSVIRTPSVTNLKGKDKETQSTNKNKKEKSGHTTTVLIITADNHRPIEINYGSPTHTPASPNTANTSNILYTPDTPHYNYNNDTNIGTNVKNVSNGNSYGNDERKKALAKLRRDRSDRKQVIEFQELVTKLLVLVFANVLISWLCLAIFGLISIYTAASIDLAVSNICLWFMFSFNKKHYKKFCSPCIAIYCYIIHHCKPQCRCFN